LVIGEIAYLLNARFLHQAAYTREGLLGSRAVLIAIGICLLLQLLFTYAPFMNVLFGTEPLDAEAWLRCIAVGGAVFVLVEMEKFVFRTWLRSGAAGGEPRSEVPTGGDRTERRTAPEPEATGHSARRKRDERT
jgi:magnesium-transporting ATPase (P-type)